MDVDDRVGFRKQPGGFWRCFGAHIKRQTQCGQNTDNNQQWNTRSLSQKCLQGCLELSCALERSYSHCEAGGCCCAPGSTSAGPRALGEAGASKQKPPVRSQSDSASPQRIRQSTANPPDTILFADADSIE
jgi:hypothetical protein